jgi:hypothetical protein
MYQERNTGEQNGCRQMTTSHKSEVRGTAFLALLLCFALTGARGQQNSHDVLPSQYAGNRGDDPDSPGYAEVLRSLRENYAESVANAAFSEATVIAKQLVEISISEKGPSNLDTAAALADLGHAQYGDEMHDAAILNFKASIGMLERLENNLSARLVDPLNGLGRAQLAEGRPDLAIESFELAVHITNVNQGPMNLGQVELLEGMIDSFTAAGDLERAAAVFDRIYQLNARVHGVDTAGILPTLQKRATWSHDTGQFHEEQDIYRQMIRIADNAGGRNDLGLIEPLTGLAYSYLYADSTWRLDRRFLSSITSGESFLKRSLRIARENPDATWEHERDALLAIADFYLFASDFSGAKRYYREAWDFLSADEERLASRALHLEQPVRLQLASPSKYITARYDENVPPDIRANREYHRGYVIAEFDITVEGRSAGIRLVEAKPPGFDVLESQVTERVGRAVYRPRHENGIPVPSQKLVYRHDFFYLTSDLSSEVR